MLNKLIQSTGFRRVCVDTKRERTKHAADRFVLIGSICMPRCLPVYVSCLLFIHTANKSVYVYVRFGIWTRPACDGHAHAFLIMHFSMNEHDDVRPAGGLSISCS